MSIPMHPGQKWPTAQPIERTAQEVKMRNPERIRLVLLVVSAIWNHHPDLRIGQLINDAAICRGINLSLIEDEDLILGLKYLDEKLGREDERTN